MKTTIDGETALNIMKMEIEIQLKDAYKIKDRLEGKDKEMIEMFISDVESINSLLDEYESKKGRLKRFKRAKVIIKLTKKAMSLKKKYKDIDAEIERIMGDLDG